MLFYYILATPPYVNPAGGFLRRDALEVVGGCIVAVGIHSIDTRGDALHVGERHAGVLVVDEQDIGEACVVAQCPIDGQVQQRRLAVTERTVVFRIDG